MAKGNWTKLDGQSDHKQIRPDMDRKSYNRERSRRLIAQKVHH
jgi:hypothetical protein